MSNKALKANFINFTEIKMLKLIHCADIHLGSKMEAKLPSAKVEERRRELRQTFNRMIEYARENGIRAILLSGDVFDSDRPLRRDKLFFYEAVKGNPDIDFIYLRGNHDGKESYTEEGLENLKAFSDSWTTYSYGDVDITGIELADKNELSLYSTLSLDSAKTNIVMLHGTVSDRSGAGLVNLRELKNRNIDYLALGHYHSYKEEALDDRARYAYSGCLEGRGFDECGECGYILIDTDTPKVSHKFISFARRAMRIISLPLDEIQSSTEIIERAAYALRSIPSSDLIRLELCGSYTPGLWKDISAITRVFENKFYYFEVKDVSRISVNPDDYRYDRTLKGEFIRLVYADNALDEETKRAVVECGVFALMGED